MHEEYKPIPEGVRREQNIYIMKKITLTFALVAMTTLSAWAFTFPEELGTAEYGKVADVPNELKEATSLYDKADIAGFTIAQYYGAYGVTGICSFDADMNAFFPPKDWLKEKTRFVGANDANQIIAIKNAKKGRKLWKSVKNICIIEIKALSLQKIS